MKLATLTIAFVAALAATSVQADDAPLNTPDAAAWNVYGAGQSVAKFRDSAVPGGGGKRVKILYGTANPWDIGANVTLDKPIHAGDKLTFAAYLKIESKDNPDATLDLPATIQINSAPYTAIIQGSMHLTTKWNLVYITGTADKDYDGKGATAATLNLGGQAKVVDLGPAYILASPAQ